MGAGYYVEPTFPPKVASMTEDQITQEIVGEFTTDPATVTHKGVHIERPGVFIVNASVTLRALNRALGWQLPTGGPKTVNGLLLEHLETVEHAGDRNQHDHMTKNNVSHPSHKKWLLD